MVVGVDGGACEFLVESLETGTAKIVLLLMNKFWALESKRLELTTRPQFGIRTSVNKVEFLSAPKIKPQQNKKPTLLRVLE